MSKLDNEFKNEVKQGFQEADYISRKIGIRIAIVVLVIAILGTIGGFAAKKWRVEKDREIFKQSTTYNEGAATFLADCYQQYNAAETSAEKNSIMQYVIMRYPNLDTDAIENQTLKQFYNKCLIGGN